LGKGRGGMEIHKLVCDVCGNEKDLMQTYFGGIDNWQTLYANNFIGYGIRKEYHLCSDECCIKHLQKT
jgi:hypothetical protein